ncbi:hypothetical protein Golax_025426 [Gossypium laxum]|uniref:Pectate lyase n=1 Tax=Gossypium laxum TaxID=34288 RepID=A0A7J9AUC0_9ROSI|nr:hypothetical protein [Gossypium laxum]MBA0727535.1 hypothetical protein [Gossypium laxum]MBA0730760.1 hypothetical protein [Gossypium laxum]
MGIAGYSYSWFLLSFFTLIPTLRAHIAEYDEYWKARELEAIENLNKAYHPNPEEVVRHYNDHFVKTMLEYNNTRRVLKGKENDPCEITNPVDSCWRCDPNWVKNRKRLADCAPGFARGTTGGKDGKFYVVTDPSDDIANPKPGTLRHAVTQLRPLWITFKKSMIIKLKQELIVTSDKTIDARGANVHICYGAGITVQFARNVIIHGLHIHHIKPATGGIIMDAENHIGLRTASDGDAISLFGATNIWLDHLSLYDSSDGLIDVIQGSTAITISNCHFTDHNEVLLFGASDTYVADEKMQITVALNHFGKGLVDRMPRCRLGFFHVVNNDYTHWFMYAIGGSSHPTIISQGNRYIASSIYVTKQVTSRGYLSPEQWKKWNWVSQGDHFVNGAYFTTSGDPNPSNLFDAEKMMPFQPGRLVPKLTRYAGTLHCRIGRPC